MTLQKFPDGQWSRVHHFSLWFSDGILLLLIAFLVVLGVVMFGLGVSLTFFVVLFFLKVVGFSMHSFGFFGFLNGFEHLFYSCFIYIFTFVIQKRINKKTCAKIDTSQRDKSERQNMV